MLKNGRLLIGRFKYGKSTEYHCLTLRETIYFHGISPLALEKPWPNPRFYGDADFIRSWLAEKIDLFDFRVFALAGTTRQGGSSDHYASISVELVKVGK